MNKTTFNILRGECEITLGNNKELIKINNNALMIISKLSGMKLSELFQMLGNGDLDSSMQFLHLFVKAGFMNGRAFQGLENPYSSETLDALIGDVSDEDLNKVFDVFTKSMQLVSGNAIAPAVEPQ